MVGTCGLIVGSFVFIATSAYENGWSSERGEKLSGMQKCSELSTSMWTRKSAMAFPGSLLVAIHGFGRVLFHRLTTSVSENPHTVQVFPPLRILLSWYSENNEPL